jgi:hypothetical protein
MEIDKKRQPRGWMILIFGGTHLKIRKTMLIHCGFSRNQEPVLAYVSSLDAPSCTLWVVLHVGNSVNMKLISSYKTFSSLSLFSYATSVYLMFMKLQLRLDIKCSDYRNTLQIPRA